MELGVIVEYEGHRWRVYKLDKGVRTMTLIRWGGAVETIADDDPRAVVVAKPNEWPVVTSRVRRNAGPLTKLSMTRRGRLENLEPLVQWVVSDPMRAGGSVFLNPQLKLSVGEVLIAEYKNGATSRIVISKRYGTVAQRKVVRSGVKRKKGLMGFLDGEDFVE